MEGKITMHQQGRDVIVAVYAYMHKYVSEQGIAKKKKASKAPVNVEKKKSTKLK